MRVASESFTVQTSGRGMTDVTQTVQAQVRVTGIGAGVATVFIHHTSASLLISENADRDVQRDLEAFMTRLVPDGDLIYRHVAEGPDDMPSHVRSVLTATSLTLPVRGGRCDLGTWHHANAVPLRDTHAFCKTFPEEVQPHCWRDQRPILSAKVIPREQDIHLPFCGIKDPLGVGAVETANVGKNGFGKVRVRAHVSEYRFDAANVHGRFKLRNAIQTVSHEDDNSLLLTNSLALRLYVAVVKPIGRGPMAIQHAERLPSGR